MTDSEHIARIHAFVKDLRIRNLPIVYLEFGEAEALALYRTFCAGIIKEFQGYPVVIWDVPTSLGAVVNRGWREKVMA